MVEATASFGTWGQVEKQPVIMAEMIGEKMLFLFASQIGTDGVVQATTKVQLPCNALVDVLDFKVTAARATGVFATTVAQVRAGPYSEPFGNGDLTVIVDFGMPRTVNAIGVPLPFKIVMVRPWNGAQFSGLAYSATEANASDYVTLPSEPRSERLSISVAGSSDSNALIAGLGLILPDAPGDLEVRIDGQSPVWTLPGPVLAGSEAGVKDGAWNTNSERLVSLAQAFAALTGDPTASGDQTFELKLTSRAPGILKIEEHRRVLRRIRRGVFNGRNETTLEFPEEGAIEVPLTAPGLPEGAAVREVRLTLEGEFDEMRTLPPVGPAEFSLVDLMLDPQRAALIRLRADSGLEKLTGLRLPLAAGEEGAEARVVLWSNRLDGVAEPVAAMRAATSEPQTLSPAPDETPVWTTFTFAAPVPFDDANPPWAAVVVTRGRAVLSLAASAVAADPLDRQVIRLGPSGGPWSLPPTGLRSGAFASVRGRSRMTGLASKKVPLAPLTAEIVGAGPASRALDARLRGLAAVIGGGPSGQQKLRLVSFAPGTVTLRNVDIVSES